MAAKFVAGSSQSLSLVPGSPNPATVPFAVAMWTCPTLVNATNRALWSAGTSGAAHDVSLGTGNKWYAESFSGSGATDGFALVGTVATVNLWYFAVARFISTTSRFIDVLYPDGSIASASDTTSVNPGVTAHAIGGLVENNTPTVDTFFDGLIAEFWMANINIQPAGGALNSAFLSQLAFSGPFSDPNVARAVTVYSSFRSSLFAEFFGAGRSPFSWTNNNGVTMGPHPPLSSSYVRPGQRKSVLMI